ncbi:response regulator transcription factor [Peristeroidobacter soli]|uniref:response regulator transcription factor n=1 Tax=Peristeroidobacter soli TaxID=2497877 RepID=UPI00158EC8B7|nr:response regulator transcription factor [Peristeroidobacter soli]
MPREIYDSIARHGFFCANMRELSDPEEDSTGPGEYGQVLVIEDHETIVAGLRWAVSTSARMATYELSFARSLREALGMLDRRVELVLLDAQLAAAGGGPEACQDALESLKREAPDVPVGIFSADESDSAVLQAIAAGAAGFISKRTSPKLLLAAIDLMRHGGLYLPPSLIATLGGAAGSPYSSGTPLAALADTELTVRQRAVLEQLLMGASNKDIAVRLGLRVGTVKNYVSGLLKLAHATTRGRLQALQRRDPKISRESH